MAYKLIIAEKPSVAASIAKLLGANTPHREKATGYLEGGGYRVTWAFGHLVGLDSPEKMGFPAGTLPIFPEQWNTHIIEYQKADMNAAVNKQMKTIDTLFKGADEIIVATDAGREGELIFRYIYEYLGCTTPFKRLWISSLTDQAIRQGMNNLRPSREMEALSQAAHARSEADYLVGFNASRALRMASGYKGNLSLGRVQTPVLVMVCDRFKANKEFVPTPYWQISAIVHKEMTNFNVLSKRKYNKEDEARADERTVAASKEMRVVNVEKKQTVSKPPLLYDLTSLQRAANTKCGLTAEQTLKVAQSLYEKKFLSYPRTGSRYIPEDVFKTIPALIDKVTGYERFNKAATELKGKKLCRKSVDDTKITDHHALLPTENIPTGLSGDEKTIWEMVTGRMLEAFGEDSLADRTVIELDCAGIRFLASGSVPVKTGWKSVFGVDEASEESDKKKAGEEEDNNKSLPSVRQNEILPAGKVETVRKTDSAPSIYTDASLLADMETCGKKIDDETLREAMKDVGLGTPATRAATIETLITRGYIYRQSKKLLPTELGNAIANTVRGRKIADVKTTGEWEYQLTQIENGRANKADFDKRIKQYVLEIINDLTDNCKSFDGMSVSKEPTRTCPCCGRPMKNQKYSVTCEQDSGGCGFRISREIAGKKLPESAINALASGKETAIIKGFKSKSGKSFDARLATDIDNKKVVFHLNATTQETQTIEGLICPCCGDTLIDDKWKLTSGCGFILYKSQCGVQLTLEQIRAIISGKPVYIKNMTSKAGKKFNASVKINTLQKKTEFVFDKNNK